MGTAAKHGGYCGWGTRPEACAQSRTRGLPVRPTAASAQRRQSAVPTTHARCSAGLRSGRRSSGSARARNGRGPRPPGSGRKCAAETVEQGGLVHLATTRPLWRQPLSCLKNPSDSSSMLPRVTRSMTNASTVTPIRANWSTAVAQKSLAWRGPKQACATRRCGPRHLGQAHGEPQLSPPTPQRRCGLLLGCADAKHTAGFVGRRVIGGDPGVERRAATGAAQSEEALATPVAPPSRAATLEGRPPPRPPSPAAGERGSRPRAGARIAVRDPTCRRGPLQA